MRDIFRVFVEKWTHPNYRPDPVSEPTLDQLEQTLQSKLPLSYKKFIEEFGPVSTILSLLSSIVAQSPTIHSLSEFFAPDNVVEETAAWQPLGLPANCIAFASDELGNKFCFARVQLSDSTPDDAAVFFFDHNERCVTKISESFVGWLYELALIRNIEST